jgi:F0F1-type ATP synthase assembly protein I
MSEQDTIKQHGDFEPTLGAAAPDVEAVLPWREVIGSLWSLFRLSGRVIFRRKLLFMSLGILAYYAILYTFAVYQPNSGFSVDSALFVLVELPGAVLGIYLAMDLIAKERDRHTLEVLFSTASSHYTVWTIRMLSVHFVLLVTLLIMSTISYFFFAEFPFIWGGLNAFLPAFLFASLTFYFSVWTRSSNAAGMIALGCLILVLMTYEAFQGTNWDLFLKPFEIPLTGEDPAWLEKMIINRVAVFVTGAGLLFLALRRMEHRERLLT